MIRCLPTFIIALILTSPVLAQPPSDAPRKEKSGGTTLHYCKEEMTTSCLVEEIQAFLTPDIDPFKRERIMLALAHAQLANGDLEQTLASYNELKGNTNRAQFLIAYSKHLAAAGDKARALERLREADALVMKDQGGLGRLNATGQSQMIAEALAQAGAPEEGRAILKDMAGYRQRIPLNPLLLVLLLQIAKDQTKIGFRDDAVTLLKEIYDQALDQDLKVTHQQVLLVFETWASIDPAAATSAARELAKGAAQNGPSAFEFAIWTGLSSSLASSEDKAEFFKYAQSSMTNAPERAAVLQFVPKLAGGMQDAGREEQARTLLDRGYAEAATLSDVHEKGPMLLAFAEGFARLDATGETEKILYTILEMAEGSGPESMLAEHAAMSVPYKFALLGKTDAAFDIAMKLQGGSREIALITTADKLAIKGNYRDAMRFLRGVEDDTSAMMMAGIAERLASPPKPPVTP